MDNKKIKNTRKREIDGITFRGTLESKCYIILRDSGLEFSYEPEKYNLIEGYVPEIQVLLPKNKGVTSSLFSYKDKKIRAITYTCDFKIVIQPNIIVVVEVKGFANDVYPLKRKLIISYFSKIKDSNEYIFAEIRSEKQMTELINYLKQTYHV